VDGRIARHEAVHEIRRDPVLVPVFEPEPPATAALRHIRIDLELNVAVSFSHLLDAGGTGRDQPKPRRLAVDGERQIAKHALGVGMLLGSGDHSVRVTIDAGQHDGEHRDTRRQANLSVDAVLLDRDDGRLQVLVQPMRESGRSDRVNDGNRGDQSRPHRAATFRP